MDFTTYVRKPFVVKAVEVTAENIEEVARSVGDVKYNDDETPYILVDPRMVPNVDRVYIGYFMTRVGKNVRCYSRMIFTQQFVEKDDTVQSWLDFLNGKETV